MSGRVSASRFDFRRVIFHISECQFHPFHRISSGCCGSKEMLRTFLPKLSHEKCPENALQGLVLLPLEWLCGCFRSRLPDTSFLHTQLLDHCPASGCRGLGFPTPVRASGWQVDRACREPQTGAVGDTLALAGPPRKGKVKQRFPGFLLIREELRGRRRKACSREHDASGHLLVKGWVFFFSCCRGYRFPSRIKKRLPTLRTSFNGHLMMEVRDFRGLPERRPPQKMKVQERPRACLPWG